MSLAVARPYASAAFTYAAQQGGEGGGGKSAGKSAGKSGGKGSGSSPLQAWEGALANMAQVVTAAAEQAQLVSDRQLAEAIGEVVKLDEAQQRFLSVLVENGRVQALPFIAQQFTALRMEQEGVVKVRVESAADIKDQKAFNNFLSEWVGAKVQTHYEQNAELIGGVRVYVRDNVLDASVLGRMRRLASSLKQGLN